MKTKKSKIDKTQINNKHVELYNLTLDSLETLINNFLKELDSYQESYLELPKNLIATLDFLISAISKVQKGQRLALNLDKETQATHKEPQINVIEGIDYKKI